MAKKSYNLKNKAKKYTVLWTWKAKIWTQPQREIAAKGRVGSPYLSESEFDPSLFEGLGKLLKLLQVTGLLQAGGVDALWC